MKLVIKHFSELTTEELYNIFKLRSDVFIVEQNCAYPDIDEADKVAYHMWLEDEDGIAAYLRVLPQGVKFDDVSLGRVISARRGCGLGARIMQEGIKAAQEIYGAKSITIGAQSYAKGFYEKQGFVQISEEFVEDGIPHILMQSTNRA